MHYITFDNYKMHKLDYINDINDIYNIINPENIIVIYLLNANITNLDQNIFTQMYIFNALANLRDLNLGYNKLTNLDQNIFNNLTNLQELDLNNNKLTYLDKDIFKNLTNLRELNLRYNKLTNLDQNIFNNLTNLRELYLNNNELTYLDKDIFKNLTNLRELSLNNNELTDLDKDIFKNLTNLNVLTLYNNKITKLDKNIFKNLTNLQELYLNNNNLTNIPSSIIYCRNLHYIVYCANEINYIPPNIQRFLNTLRQKTNTLQIYNDTQNVHNHHIQECIKSSLENILNYPKVINKDNLFNYLINDSKMTERSIQLLLEYCQDEAIHTVLNITFEEVLLHILEYIKLEIPNNFDNIIEILEIEILDSECKCFTGRISRLINCLNGFTPLVKVEIPDNMAISNIIIMITRNYKGVKCSLQELKDITKHELLERGYNMDVIKEYIEYIDI